MKIGEIFATQVFNDAVMRERLPKKIYQSLKETTRLGAPLNQEIADVVAAAMKDWATGLGATHYSHWFQPLNNLSAGKHDSFISTTRDGNVVTEFSSSALVKGEPDASSFPSGGLRATFEARGYTTWDPTSPAFVRDGTLYIPTAFCSYTGEALDSKTPLLRSMQALNKQGLRLLRALGHNGSRMVYATVGAEQEYFLIDKEKYEKRLDLKLCGRTLLGAKPAKGQELEDHYCGRIRLRVASYMTELDNALWALGVTSKTKHNEAAPAQHELAPIFEPVNTAVDHNLLTMEVMRVTAKRHNLACLLHEKPFEGINGSGKHNNFSISTDDGLNFLDPGQHPEENKLFLITLCALIEGVDTYADLIRMTAASPSNDHRLGGYEAPPAIISIFLGEALTTMLSNITKGSTAGAHSCSNLYTDVDALPNLERDDSDRNRTSPFAFTNNKFEFRMVGSSQSIAFCNTVLDAVAADVFSRFADRLEKAEDLELEISHIISETICNHGRILYNGNNYTQQWVEEAQKRGLPIISNSAQAAEAIVNPRNVEMLESLGILSSTECHARYEIHLENIVKVITMEAETMQQMVRQQILPSLTRFIGDTAASYNELAGAGFENAQLHGLLEKLSGLLSAIHCESVALEALEHTDHAVFSLKELANYMTDTIRPQMHALRTACDAAEALVASDVWPIPTYTDLLHRI
ncbi:glutamine synthetase III [Oscillospiraceae bacterium MB08-C2-2]|nr:glutamine synthetase III [Oscillospiraceae bacterium MB08-C2-2]